MTKQTIYKVVIRSRATGEHLCTVGMGLTDMEANQLAIRTRLLLDTLRDKGVLSFNTPVNIMPELEAEPAGA